MGEIMVSIACLTYNHERYIADAIEGFLRQKTNFKFEILIHDDASTDRTQSIIREYEEKHPDIIKPIYQKENQHSQGKNATVINCSRSKGKYIALCEGDDYWTDEYKLQKQVDYMESHEGCTYCFTNAIIENQVNGERRPFIPYSKADAQYYTGESREYTVGEMYQLSFIPTASLLLRGGALFSLPKKEIMEPCPAEDLKFRLFMTAAGYAYYMSDVMCVYRENVPMSAMTRWKHAKKEDVFNRSKSIVKMINNVDRVTEYKYTAGLSNIRIIHERAMLYNLPKWSALGQDLVKKAMRECTVAQKLKVLIKLCVPQKLIKLVKRRK